MQTNNKDIFSNVPWVKFLYYKRLQMNTGFWDNGYAADFSQRVQGLKLSTTELGQLKKKRF